MAVVELPAWVEYTKALGAPLVALVAGAIAASIAYRQWVTARNKLKLDFFDRRMHIYKNAVDLINEYSKAEPADWKRVGELSNALVPARFIFDTEVSQYLEQLTVRAYLTASKKAALELEGMSLEERAEFAKELARTAIETARGELTELNRLLAPFLTVEH